MNTLHRQDGQLHLEDVALSRLAEQFDTPLYVYSRQALEAAYQAYADALADTPHLICYAVKANSSLAILNLFARLGAGFDIVSGGELARVLAAGGNPAKVVFSGVGKTIQEMRAGLEAAILCFNVESASELQRLNRIAGEMGKIAPVSFRVNPDVDPKTHPYISTGLKENKFGIAIADAPALYRLAASLPHLQVTGIDCHIGSQLVDLSPLSDAADRVLALVDTLAAEGIALHHIDLGGGIGIRYRDETPPDLAAYGRELAARFKGRSEKLLLEPGRSLVGNAGLLLTRVEYLKPGEDKNFAIVDAAMNDLMRPALYEAYHEIVAVDQRNAPSQRYDVVGPICETGDFLGVARDLSIEEGDLLALLSAGAYGMSMASNYNSRPRAAEILIDKNEIHLIRERETQAGLMAGERLVY
ncbi:MAG TPA: diaminopimelate decarboxylase [Thiobacillus sp.]|nr:MAG: diaminopimelate decarboxylase [Hydrogenophilales bacterium 28-61-11]OYZ56906.1 MAG: diaminopimelate decarboxylase [Hydrogenophilales bacterium 16-61-112]OZA46076.1 MAG: diaminopimelate decarboxylase [Hydrogenophilales bacterium 17-61-76]HQT29946.1 diaminopimelate decarboxylase [Thiobacillus sp.]HQT69327.1 diaminopimelate decarboxylase [Thiobacillus sp.]